MSTLWTIPNGTHVRILPILKGYPNNGVVASSAYDGVEDANFYWVTVLHPANGPVFLPFTEDELEVL